MQADPTPESVAGIWKRLSGLAGQIRDAETRAQYLSAWRARYDAAFPPPSTLTPPPLPPDADEFCLPSGTSLDGPSPGERARLERIAAAWWAGEVPRLLKLAGSQLKAVAYHAARRVAAGLLDAEAVTADVPPQVLTQPGWGEAWRDGLKRPFDVSGQILALRCARHPMTEYGLAERFNDRHGHDFLYTTAKGWLGWDARRWRVLDQEKDAPPAELVAAVMDTVRAVQDEARMLGMAIDSQADADRIRAAKSHAAHLASWGRECETASRIGSVIRIAKRWRTRMIEDFDVEPGAINCQNGTLRVIRADGRALVSLDPHARADLITRLAPVPYDPQAAAPLFDALIKWAQPARDMRRYLRQWAGYCLTGHTGAQILHFWHGGGANGKSTVIDAWAGAIGDYGGTIGIETFLDQGIKKRGEAATPDLARLGGVRLLRASEPERNAKINAALVKAVTGGEPMAVRALHKGFFDLRPAFKLTVSFNPKPKIPDTDEGIWRRIKLVEWGQFRELADRDEDLPNKLKAEYPGIFAWMVRGLVDWIEHGFTEPDAVRTATQDYRDASDPLARFLAMCVRKADGKRVQSSHLFEVFAAWCKATGESEWSPRGFKAAMHDKGFSDKMSNGVQWLGIELIRRKSDFIEEAGKVILLPVEPAPAADDGGGLPEDW